MGRGKTKPRRSNINKGPGRHRNRVDKQKAFKARLSNNLNHSHVFQAKTAPLSMVSQAAAIASTTQELTLPRKERVIRDEQKQSKQRELNIIFNRVGEGTPLTVDYLHPVFFKVKGGAELPSHLLGGCTVLNVDVLCIRLPSLPDAGLVCHLSKSNNPVCILTPHRLTLKKLEVHDVNYSHDLGSTLEKVMSV